MPKPARSRTTSAKPPSGQPALIFDLDGTLIDSVYQHTLAWREALYREGISLPGWLIHRRIGMSGGLLVRTLVRETGRKVDHRLVEHLQRLHSQELKKRWPEVRALPGAAELLAALSAAGVRWAIATSGTREGAQKAMAMLGVKRVLLVTRDEVSRAKPDPDLFLEAARKLRTDLPDCVVVGDSVWDLLAARRAKALGVGQLSGGFGEDELLKAGAYRVYQDPEDLLHHLDEIGIRGSA